MENTVPTELLAMFIIWRLEVEAIFVVMYKNNVLRCVLYV